VTDLNAPRYRIIAIDVNKPERKNWVEVIPEKKSVISNAQIINNHFVIVYTEDVKHKIEIYTLGGEIC
jgi:prolyl oligopeptidase